MSDLNALKWGMTCFWKIEDFILCESKKNLLLRSCNFKADLFNRSIWHFEIRQNNWNALSFYILKDIGGEYEYNSIHYSISLLNSSGWLVLLKDKWERFKSEGVGYGMCDFITWREITEQDKFHLPNKALTLKIRMWNTSTEEKTVCCAMSSRMVSGTNMVNLTLNISETLSTEVFEKSFSSYSSQTNDKQMLTKKSFKTTGVQTEFIGENKEFNDLENLLSMFRNNEFHYITIQVGKKEFVVHKALLCSRSPTFEAMLKTSTKENAIHKVYIDDIEGETMSLLLKFLHMGVLEDLIWEDAAKLFCAADKYQILNLKKKCVSILESKLSDDTVCEAIILADEYHQEDLTNSARKYFCDNSKCVLRSKKFKDFLLDRTELASRLLQESADQL